MRNFILPAFVFILSLSLNAQEIGKPNTAGTNSDVKQQIDPNGPVIKFEKQTIDYGTIDKGADGMREFKFTNTGKSPLKIIRVKSSCGCTIPTYPKGAIMPGESNIIHVKYNTNKAGRFSKSVSIFTNTVPERSVLRIKGKVVDSNKPGPIQKEKNMLEL